MSKIANEILLQLERKYPNHTLLNNQPILRFLLEKSIEDVLDNDMLINNNDQAISATVDDSDVEKLKVNIKLSDNMVLYIACDNEKLLCTIPDMMVDNKPVISIYEKSGLIANDVNYIKDEKKVSEFRSFDSMNVIYKASKSVDDKELYNGSVSPAHSSFGGKEVYVLANNMIGKSRIVNYPTTSINNEFLFNQIEGLEVKEIKNTI
ncbi:MAG: hypothetical protein J5892_01795 [Bacilli bacterium]|nr:hypothetical protein [Bacilli bacterium]